MVILFLNYASEDPPSCVPPSLWRPDGTQKAAFNGAECIRPPMQARLRDVNMFYTTDGSGPSVVLVHGFPLDHTMWTPQIEYLSREYQIVTPDLRGHGRSETTAGPYTMELLGQDVNALLEHLKLESVVLGGFSMGGYAVLAFMRQFAHKVRGLILVDTRAVADTQEAQARREQQAQGVLKNGAAELANQMIGKMFTEGTLRENPLLVARVREVMESTTPVGIAETLRGMALRQDSTSLLESIRVPTLIIVGRQDSLTTVDDAQYMAGKIPNAQLEIVPDAAHLTTLERPQLVNLAIGKFLGKISK